MGCYCRILRHPINDIHKAESFAKIFIETFRMLLEGFDRASILTSIQELVSFLPTWSKEKDVDRFFY